MTVYDMDSRTLKLYTVPHSLQPVRRGPLTMSGVGVVKPPGERPTPSPVPPTPRGSSAPGARSSKGRPKSSMTLYYMQRPYGTIVKPEQIALSSLNITAARKLTLQRAKPRASSTPPTSDSSPSSGPKTPGEYGQWSPGGASPALVLSSGQRIGTLEKNENNLLPKRNVIPRNNIAQHSSNNIEKCSQVNSDSDRKNNSGSILKYSRYVPNNTEFSDVRKEDLQSYLQKCHNLKRFEGDRVSASDVVNAEKFFGPLAHITTSQLPQSRLASLLGETKRKQLQAATEDKARKSPDSFAASRTTVESVGRAGLTYTSRETIEVKSKEQLNRRKFVASYVEDLSKEAVLADQKRTALRKIWPQVLEEMVQNVVLDMWDSTAYMKKCLEDFEKS